MFLPCQAQAGGAQSFTGRKATNPVPGTLGRPAPGTTACTCMSSSLTHVVWTSRRPGFMPCPSCPIALLCKPAAARPLNPSAKLCPPPGLRGWTRLCSRGGAQGTRGRWSGAADCICHCRSLASSTFLLLHLSVKLSSPSQSRRTPRHSCKWHTWKREVRHVRRLRGWPMAARSVTTWSSQSLDHD